MVYVALEYPKWQRQVLVKLREMCGNEDNPSLPSNKEVLEKLKTLPDVMPHMKKLMPFVAMVKVGPCLYPQSNPLYLEFKVSNFQASKHTFSNSLVASSYRKTAQICFLHKFLAFVY